MYILYHIFCSLFLFPHSRGLGTPSVQNISSHLLLLFCMIVSVFICIISFHDGIVCFSAITLSSLNGKNAGGCQQFQYLFSDFSNAVASRP